MRAQAREGSPFRVTRRLVRPAFHLCVFKETNSERKNIMQDEDIIPLEALDLLRNASDELLSMATCGQIDLHTLARWELRSRRRDLGLQWIGALAGSSEP